MNNGGGSSLANNNSSNANANRGLSSEQIGDSIRNNNNFNRENR